MVKEFSFIIKMSLFKVSLLMVRRKARLFTKTRKIALNSMHLMLMDYRKDKVLLRIQISLPIKGVLFKAKDKALGFIYIQMVISTKDNG
jgi:hypothetical protein